MGGVILHSLDLHYNSHNAQCCWLTHLVSRVLVSWLRAMRSSVILNGVGAVIAAGWGSAAGSGEHSVQRDGEGWLGSGLGVGLELSSAGQTEKDSPFFSSTHPSGEILLGTVSLAGVPYTARSGW